MYQYFSINKKVRCPECNKKIDTREFVTDEVKADKSILKNGIIKSNCAIQKKMEKRYLQQIGAYCFKCGWNRIEKNKELKLKEVKVYAV